MSDAALDINNQEQIEEVVTEARAEYSLLDRLKGINRRSETVITYTDEVLGEKHGKLKEQLDDLKALIKPIEGVVLTQEVIDATNAEIEKWQPALDAARAELEKSAFVFTLHALPPIAEKVITRETRKAMGIKGQIPDERVEEWISLYNARMISQQVDRFEDRLTGVTKSSISIDEALWLEEQLPKWEYAKLKAKADDLQLRNTIGELATDSADF